MPASPTTPRAPAWHSGAVTDPFDLTLTDLRRRTSVKWRAFPDDVLPLFVAEMDVHQSEHVVAAVEEAMREGDTGYPAGSAYAEAFAAFATRRYGWSPDPAAMRLVPTVMTGVAAMIRALTDPGDAVVISPPVYPPFVAFTRDADRRIVHAPLTGTGRLDPAALDEAFARATAGGRRAVYLLCQPHNPTGTVHSAAELARLGELAAAHGVRVVSDEIHAPLVLDPAVGLTPAPTVIPDAIALVSASKAFNLAALPAALAVPGPAAVDDVARLPEVVGHPVAHLGVIAQTAALTHGDAWLDAVLLGLRARADHLEALLADRLPTVSWLRGPATYLAWLDLRATLPDQPHPEQWLVEHARVALTGGAGFGPQATGFARLNFATTTALLDEAIDRMATALGR